MRSGRSFVGLIVVLGLFFLLMLIGVVGNVRTGNYIVIPIMTTALGLFIGAIWFSRYRVRVFLRDRTPDRIIGYYHRSVRRMPQAHAAAAYLSAVAASFFGEYERARQQLDAVDWNGLTPVYQGHRSYALAVLALLEDTDYAEALRLADEGNELQKGDPAGGLTLLDDAIRLVADGENAERVERLEKVARKQQGLMPGVCAWALAVYYKRNGNAERASEFKAILKDLVPHCAALRTA